MPCWMMKSSSSKACCDANTLASHAKRNWWSALLIYSLLYMLQSSKWSNRKSACSEFSLPNIKPTVLNFWQSPSYFNHSCPFNRPCCAFHSTCKTWNLHTNKINNTILIYVLLCTLFKHTGCVDQVLALCVDMSQGHAIIGLSMAFVRWWLGSFKKKF